MTSNDDHNEEDYTLNPHTTLWCRYHPPHRRSGFESPINPLSTFLHTHIIYVDGGGVLFPAANEPPKLT